MPTRITTEAKRGFASPLHQWPDTALSRLLRKHNIHLVNRPLKRVNTRNGKISYSTQERSHKKRKIVQKGIECSTACLE